VWSMYWVSYDRCYRVSELEIGSLVSLRGFVSPTHVGFLGHVEPDLGSWRYRIVCGGDGYIFSFTFSLSVFVSRRIFSIRMAPLVLSVQPMGRFN